MRMAPQQYISPKPAANRLSAECRTVVLYKELSKSEQTGLP
ncbi:hypothetical protein KNP414_03943 [Paenibacillus mucilaginosus KNP414]|uniref:Uncharacterized protein n=1 Tax=Paenibacillus mucilaginosus (strain KNP414) TaxID=1036673 RepID=F8F933_PAEMK|nr:hypothetical protein KNP414_03943 [Paenibacillus mucilaginosus KNP414]